MSRKAPEIKVIMHLPEDKASLVELQKITNTFYAEMIAKRFKNANLTPEERSYVVKKITENLKKDAAT